MSKKDKELGYARRIPVVEVAAILDQISAGLRAGRISLALGEDSVLLEPSKDLEVALSARQKRDRESLELKLKWPKIGAGRQETPLKICTGEAKGDAADRVLEEGVEHSHGRKGEM